MGVEDFYTFIKEKLGDKNVFISADLLKMAQAVGVTTRKPPKAKGRGGNVQHNRRPGAKLCIVIDAECCLDRLYGGFYTDWSCGGQWTRVVEFLRLLFVTIKGNMIDVVVFFNGALHTDRCDELLIQESMHGDKVRQILTHVKRKQTPPPKVLWMPPAGLRACLRLILRHLMIPVFQTFHDHKQEVMTFLRENEFDALLGEGAEYFFFDPPKYLSAGSLTLTFKGLLNVNELVQEYVCNNLDIHPNRLCLVAAMLGNHLIKAEEMKELYKELLPDSDGDINKIDFMTLIPVLVAFVRNLPDEKIDSPKDIGDFIFRNESLQSVKDNRASRFTDAVHYYMNATAENFHKYFKTKSAKDASNARNFASDIHNQQTESVASVTKALDKVSVKETEKEQNGVSEEQREEAKSEGEQNGGSTRSTGTPNSVAEGDGNTTPPRVDDKMVTDKKESTKQATKTMEITGTPLFNGAPKINSEILKAAANRHYNGLMHHWIYSILTQGEVGLDSHLEDGTVVPFGFQVWRRLRQSVYAILFDLNHKLFLLKQQKARKPEKKKKPVTTNGTSCEEKKEGEDLKLPLVSEGNQPGKYPKELSTRLYVREWVWGGEGRRGVGGAGVRGRREELVEVVGLTWHGVPTLRRLWFDQAGELREKRMKAFLTCMLSDTPLMMNQEHVPNHLLILCCVLRYMVAYSEQRILEYHELDAFLSVAVSPQLNDPNTVQDILGVEHAMFANDACGSPVPWPMVCPWLYFDGKLLQIKLDIANRNRTLSDLCNGNQRQHLPPHSLVSLMTSSNQFKQMDQINCVVKMRQAVLEGLEFLFHLPPQHHSHATPNPALAQHVSQRLAMVARGRGMIGRSDILASGGRLEIGGVIVSQWKGQGDKNSQHNPPPIITRVRGGYDAHMRSERNGREGGRGRGRGRGGTKHPPHTELMVAQPISRVRMVPTGPKTYTMAPVAPNYTAPRDSHIYSPAAPLPPPPMAYQPPLPHHFSSFATTTTSNHSPVYNNHTQSYAIPFTPDNPQPYPMAIGGVRGRGGMVRGGGTRGGRGANKFAPSQQNYGV